MAVDVVGHYVDYDLYAIFLGFVTQLLKFFPCAVAISHESEIVRHVGIEPFGILTGITLNGRYLYRSETGFGNTWQFLDDISEFPVETMHDVTVLNILRNTIRILGMSRKDN